MIEIKFPCGYELKVTGLSEIEFNYDVENGCPIHGRNCKNTARKVKRTKK